MERQNERLFRVLGDIGPDLIATAETKTFTPSPWRRILPVAASLVIVAGLAMAAAPYFLVKETAPAASAPAPQIQEMPAMEEAVPAEETPETLPADEPRPPAVIDKSLWAEPKEKVILLDTIYYYESTYSDHEAVEVMGPEIKDSLTTCAYLGNREGGGNLWDVGQTSYVNQYAGTPTATDDQGRAVPREIFLRGIKTYYYCKTFFQSSLPVVDWEMVQLAMETDQINQLAESLILPMERARIGQSVDLEYGEGETLGPDQLVRFFLATLELERTGSIQKGYGLRTTELDDYLWLQEDGTYVIPLAEVQEQLEKYSDREEWNLEEAKAYDSVRNALVLATLELPEPPKGIHLETSVAKSLENEGQGLYLEVHVFRGGEKTDTRTYILDFTDGRVVYKAMETVG